MTLQQARTDLIAQASLDLDLYRGVSIDAEGNAVEESEGATDLISRACIWWSKLTHCCYDPSVPLTLVIGQNTYDCRDLDVVGTRIVQPRTVIINDNPLVRRDGRKHGLWVMDELQRFDPKWRTAANSVPTIAVWLPTNKLQLYAPPAATYTGKNFIEAWTMPNDLVVGEDDDVELPVPTEDHMSIVRLALAFGSLPNVSEGEAWQRLSANDGWWINQADRRKRENVTAFLGRKSRGGNTDWLYA